MHICNNKCYIVGKQLSNTQYFMFFRSCNPDISSRYLNLAFDLQIQNAQ